MITTRIYVKVEPVVGKSGFKDCFWGLRLYDNFTRFFLWNKGLETEVSKTDLKILVPPPPHPPIFNLLVASCDAISQCG